MYTFYFPHPCWCFAHLVWTQDKQKMKSTYYINIFILTENILVKLKSSAFSSKWICSWVYFTALHLLRKLVYRKTTKRQQRISQVCVRKKSTPSCRLHDSRTTGGWEGDGEINMQQLPVITAILIKLIANPSRLDNRLLLFSLPVLNPFTYPPLWTLKTSLTDAVTSERGKWQKRNNAAEDVKPGLARAPPYVQSGELCQFS